MASDPRAAYAFGQFTLVLTQKRLLSDREVVPLAPKVFDTLVLLVENRGRLVQKEELLKALWPDTVVEEQALAHNVSQLRKVLRDSADDPRFIETVPKRGYRFVAPVRAIAEPAPLVPSPAVSGVDAGIAATGADAVSSPSAAPPTPRSASSALGSRGWIGGALIILVVLAGTWAFGHYRGASKPAPLTSSGAPPAAEKATSSTSVILQAEAAAFNPPPNSVAVLPFVNISGERKEEYFSDGLTEELLSSLTRVNDLQVAAQTSSFYFKGKDADLTTIAHTLNVGAVLEGSVRRSGQRVRVTAQLIDSTTGFHLWSQTFDRNLGDVLSLQTEIANAVANALKVTLLGDTAVKIELGGSRNPTAFDAYLRGSKGFSTLHGGRDLQSAIDAYSEAIRLDSNYALAFARRSLAVCQYADAWEPTIGSRNTAYGKAVDDALRAIALAPALGEAHLALARVLWSTLDFRRADQEYARALALAPGNATALQNYGVFAASMGRAKPGLSALNRAVVLDPLSPFTHYWLGEARFFARRYSEAVTAFDEVTSLDPNFYRAYGFRGYAYYELGDLQRARASCENYARSWVSEVCLVLTYEKLGRRADAEAALAKYRARIGEGGAYQYVEIYAQRGNVTQALEWLEFAFRVHDPALGWLKTDPLLDPLRQEPRFQAIERELRFPD